MKTTRGENAAHSLDVWPGKAPGAAINGAQEKSNKKG